MTITTKLVLSLIITAGTVLVVEHGADALKPAIPKDMPSSSYFVQSGYDVDRNEPTGDWIACKANTSTNTDFCRVTDSRGSVIYQGDFLPVNGNDAVPARDLHIAINEDNKIWVQGPAEDAPVPVIPLVNGEVLVPSDDSYALGNRWSNNPEELRQIQGD